MIERISDTTTNAVTALPSQKEAIARVGTKTPFGDFLVGEMATTNMAALFGKHSTVSAAVEEARESNAPASTPPNSGTAAISAKKVSADVIPTPAIKVDPNYCPTAESIFGDQVFASSPSGHGPNGTHWSYNPAYFATRQTAEVVAKMVGGTVFEQNAICPSGPMIQDQVNEMILLPNGKQLNAGLVADIFNHGRSQAVVDQMLKEEVAGAYDPSAL